MSSGLEYLRPGEVVASGLQNAGSLGSVDHVVEKCTAMHSLRIPAPVLFVCFAYLGLEAQPSLVRQSQIYERISIALHDAGVALKIFRTRASFCRQSEILNEISIDRFARRRRGTSGIVQSCGKGCVTKSTRCSTVRRPCSSSCPAQR